MYDNKDTPHLECVTTLPREVEDSKMLAF